MLLVGVNTVPRECPYMRRVIFMTCAVTIDHTVASAERCECQMPFSSHGLRPTRRRASQSVTGNCATPRTWFAAVEMKAFVLFVW